MLPALSRAELKRYSRHLIIPEVGIEGQERLKAARVLVVGAGGARLAPRVVSRRRRGRNARSGRLRRRRSHQPATPDPPRDLRRRPPKTASARQRIAEVNPHVRLETHETRLTSHNALDVLRDYDLVVDGTDNVATRYLVNDACVLLRKPNVYGSIFRFEGQASVFATTTGPCYRCIYPQPPPLGRVPSCAEGGVFGVLPGRAHGCGDPSVGPGRAVALGRGL